KAMGNSTVALLHGHDVFEAYKAVAPNPYVVNNICVTEGDHIPPAALEAKRESVLKGGPLEIVYAGRAIGMKGPFEWLRTLILFGGKGVAYRAPGFGGGGLLEPMRAFVVEHKLDNAVTIAGKVERSAVFEAAF